MKKFLSELLLEEVGEWGASCRVIDSPTGSGKTTFVVNFLIDHFAKYETVTKRKVWILCNRRLLRKQYWGQIITKYNRYSEIENSVMIKTYQELANEIQHASNVTHLFDDACAVICDEFHYFYADSDFNAIGTYPLLNAIVQAGVSIPVFFLSATTDEVLPLLRETVRIQQSLLQEAILRDVNSAYPDWEKIAAYSRPIDGFKVVHHKFRELVDYSRFECYSVPDNETLCQTIAQSSGKSVVFIDNRKEAEEIKNHLIEVGVSEGDIGVLNADNIDSDKMRDIIDPLVYTNKLSVRVLITTSVLDNGVSIMDDTVESVVIVTESKISFLQMLGRVRAGDEERKIRLIFKMREPEVFRIRAERYKKINAVIAEIKESPEKYSALRVIRSFWNSEDSEMHDIYRSIFAPLRPDNCFMPDDRAKVVSSDGMALQFKNYEISFYLNRFAVEKIGNMQIAEERFYRDAMLNPLEVIYSQMGWIDKKPEALHIINSVVEEEFVKEALKINGLNFEEYTMKKEELVKRFKNVIFKGVNTKNGTVSKDKFKSVLHRVGLDLRDVKDDERKTLYYVKRKEAETEEEEVTEI